MITNRTTTHGVERERNLVSARLAGIVLAALYVAVLAESVALAQYAIDWHTIDDGGAMNASDGLPGGFELSGTIGQHDAVSPAAPMTGGTFELTGGFWPVTQVCYCPGDLNHDGLLNGGDIQQFVNCVLSSGNCSCADVDLVGGITLDDAEAFVADLLAGMNCS